MPDAHAGRLHRPHAGLHPPRVARRAHRRGERLRRRGGGHLVKDQSRARDGRGRSARAHLTNVRRRANVLPGRHGRSARQGDGEDARRRRHRSRGRLRGRRGDVPAPKVIIVPRESSRQHRRR